MNRLASPAQLRASLLRWALFVIPAVMLAGFLSGQLGGNTNSLWFSGLEKPEMIPSSFVLSIVWPALYFLMGLALAMVCSAWGSRVRIWAILAFIVALGLVLAWSPVFFGQQDIGMGLGVSIAAIVALLMAVWLFFKTRKLAGILMLPALIWVAFIAYQNWQVLELNPDANPVEESGAVQRMEL